MTIEKSGFIEGNIRSYETKIKYGCPKESLPENQYYNFNFTTLERAKWFYIKCEADGLWFVSGPARRRERLENFL